MRIDKKKFEEEESDASQAAFDQSFSHSSPELPRLLLLPTYYRWDEYDDLWMIGGIGNGDLSVGRMDRWADTNSVSSWRWMDAWMKMWIVRFLYLQFEESNSVADPEK